LALGDAFERQNEFSKALVVYMDLKSLGVKVQGLKEKIVTLEQKIKSKSKSDQVKQQRDVETDKLNKLKQQQEQDRVAKEADKK
jgi:hypothetical protein